MSQAFDPYHLWLGIPPAEQPPHFYRLLGLRPLESNPQVIDNAAQRVTAHLRGYLANPTYQPAAQWLIGEVTRASESLLDPVQKAIYDSLLASRLAIPTSPAPAPAPLTPRLVANPAQPVAMPTPAVQPVQPARRPITTARTVPPPKKVERIPQPVKIILGGIGGLVMGYFIVLLITGNDVFGMWPARNPPVAQRPAANPPRPQKSGSAPKLPSIRPAPAAAASSPEPSPRPEESPGRTQPLTSKTPLPAGRPVSPPGFPPGLVPPPGFAPPGFAPPGFAPPGIALPPVAPPPSFAGRPPVNVAPLPGTPATPTPQASAKLPVPSPEAQQKSLAELQMLYKSEFDKGNKADGRAGLVAFLLEAARKLKSDPAAQFVLYREAYQRALALDDLYTVAEVIDELERHFDIDGYVFRMNLLTAALKVAKGPEERVTCLQFVLHLADYAESAARIEDLAKLAGMAENLARGAANKELKVQANSRAAELRRTIEEFAPVSSARQKLAADPGDSAASFTDGKFRCFVQGDWARGLPLLAQSDHGALATAAKLDLAGTPAGKPAATIGDAWFDMGAVDPGLAGAYARARHWYLPAAAGLDGLEKVKIEKRLEQIGAMKLPTRLSAPENSVTLQSARFLVSRSKPIAATDVVGTITPESFRTPGWTVRSNSLRVDSNAFFARLQAPQHPTGEYQVALQLIRYTNSPAGPLIIGLSHWQSQVAAMIDVPTADKRYASFLTLGGLRRPEENPTLKTTEDATPWLGTGRVYNIACTVRRREIIVRLDGQPFLEFKGDANKLYLPKDWSVPDGRAIFVGAHQAGFDIRGWAVAPLYADDGTELPLLTDPQQIRAPVFQTNRQPGP